MQSVFAWIGGGLGASISLPQIVRTMRVGTDGVSAMTWSLMAGVTGGWAIWGLVQGNEPLIVTNALACLGACILLVRLAAAGRRPTPLVLLAPVVLISLNVGRYYDVLPVWLAGGANVIAPVSIRMPQLRALRGGSIVGVSTTTWLMSCASQISWIVSAVGNDGWLLAANAANLVMNVTLIAAIRRRRVARPTLNPVSPAPGGLCVPRD